MGIPLRMLVHEDSPDDAELNVAQARQAGYKVDWQRVDSEADFIANLDPSVDVILSDYNVPGLNGEQALKALRHSGLDIPFIIVTGTLGDEKAVELIKQGATDYVLKENLARLGEAIKRALADTNLRREHKQLEEKLRKLGRAVEQTSSSVVITSLTGEIEYVNPRFSELTGYAPEEVIGQTPRVLKSGEMSQDEYKALWDTIAAGRDWRGEFQNRKKDRTIYIASAVISPIKNELGQVTHFIGIEEDITERKKAEAEVLDLNAKLEQRVIMRTAELKAANDALESFSYSVSHDLRAPLRAIDGYSSVLLQEYGEQLPDEARRYVDVIRRNVGQMGQLIDDLLEFSRTGRAPLERQSVNMADLVKLALARLQSEQEGRTVELVVDSLPAAHGDPALLTQVWQNLIANALKFTRQRENARIEIGSKRAKGEVVYYVRDNGAGFDMKYADKLFGVFQRLHRAEEFEGTGVGLATVQRIVQRHGGRVWAEAQEGKGAAFYFAVGGEDSNG